MLGLLQVMNTEFASTQQITDLVADRCNFVLDPQNASELPLISYNAYETDRVSKDGLKEYQMEIAVIAASVVRLLEIYEACQNVIDNEVQGFTSYFEGSSPVDLMEDRDDLFIIVLNYRIEYK